MPYNEKKAVLQLITEDSSEPFAVIRAKELVVHSKSPEKDFPGQIDQFFPLMGTLDPLKDEGATCVICWIDNKDDEWKKLQGVKFHSFEDISEEKPLYRVKFVAKTAML
ncbi:MAG TPA: hypothetical protein VKK79_05145 [Candidatus Lokiarchaeia archaeon]|nr:hypothetical protein [Candidatus Lokiarchaeia archaeon]